LDDLLATARRIGLDGVCITDHETTQASSILREGIQADGLLVLVGREYATAQGDFLIYGPGRNAPLGLGPEELLRHVSQSGGAMVPAHPFRQGRSCDGQYLDSRFCPVMEGINGRCSAEENREALAWAARQGLAVVGGSDAHAAPELGGAVTVFDRKLRSSHDLVQALGAGDFRAVCRDSASAGTILESIAAA
jgi:predicted metal-dependent phosphoesterase TrpH